LLHLPLTWSDFETKIDDAGPFTLPTDRTNPSKHSINYFILFYFHSADSAKHRNMLLLTAYTWLISDYVYWETNSVYFSTQTDSTYGYYLLSFEPFSCHVGRQSERDRGKPIQYYALHQKHTWTA
jgi:hypothetical protein